MRFQWFVVLALTAGVALMSGCDGNKSRARSMVEATQKAPVTLSEIFTGKTPGGKPVRVFKIELQAPNGEHLLMVVGETSVPVTMKDASTVKIGDQEISDPSYLPTGSGLVFVVKTSGSQFLDRPFTNNEFIDPNAPQPNPDVRPTFPMELFKAKVSGQTLNLPALDTL